ncbi:dTMP kinase [Chitinimonas naiadis]
MSPTSRGRFISLEGLDGAGKSTHLSWLTARLSESGIDHVVTREPGGTPLGEKLRELLLHEAMHLETEALLMFAVRREHLAQVIEPALAAGRWVVCDRFTDATYAYQVGGRGLALDKFGALEQWVQGRGDSLLEPDLTLLFDVPLEVSRARLANGRDLDRFEREQDAFFERVRSAYHARAAGSQGRLRVLDASQSVAEVQADLVKVLAGLGVG